MIDSARLSRWTLDIVQGKTDPPADLTSDERDAFARLVMEIADIRARGAVVDIPGEIADAQED
jgi:hypothetical protein